MYKDGNDLDIDENIDDWTMNDRYNLNDKSNHVILRKNFIAKRTESFPKSAIKTHKKTLSNVERMSFNLEKNGSPLLKLKDLSYERKTSLFLKKVPSSIQINKNSRRPSLTSVDGNLTDPLSSENLLLRGSKLKNTDFIYGIFLLYFIINNYNNTLFFVCFFLILKT